MSSETDSVHTLGRVEQTKSDCNERKKQRNKMKWPWLRHEMWNGHSHSQKGMSVYQTRYGQFYVKSKVLKWKAKPKQNCNSLKNNSLLKDIFVLHKIWFEKFESLSFPSLKFWRQIDIVIGNFRYKTVKYTVWKRWIDGLNIKNCNVVWRKVFHKPRHCTKNKLTSLFYQQPRHNDKIKRWL